MMSIDKCVASGMDGRVMMRGLRMLSLSPFVLVVACGGGGSDVASTPPPPAGPSYQKLADITASTTLATQAATYEFSSNGPTRSQASNIEISYDPASKTYTLRGAPVIGSTTTVTQNFGPSDAIDGVQGSYENITTTVGRTDVRRLYIGIPSMFTYTGWGSWTVGATTGPSQVFDTVYFSYGIATQAADMPKSGSASYSLQVTGQGSLPVVGTGSLIANFATATVDVSLPLKAVVAIQRPGSTAPPELFATLVGSGPIGSVSSNPGFTAALAGDGYTGSINGLFYGPRAAEVGGAFSVANDGRYMGPVVGAILGKKN